MPRLAWVFISLGALFALTHAVAVRTTLYWYQPWFDNVMHFWGGILIVLGLYVIVGIFTTERKPRKRIILLVALTAILGWEFFEQVAGITSAPLHLLDTMKDILVGLTGVLVGYAVLRKKA